ncbi:hypothetical protein PG993_011099 [Apiospora rasikravindrae]|uniref:Uncharacterized protein n=1 Tax=Apiospora rasikravindrae TaxID=990691 RepID=A0ABR1SDD5_9PEZI
MSAQARPPTAAEFASALTELPASSLALKVLEMRNQIAHLDYSNSEMKPFADGADGAEPDQICIDGIRENEEIIVKVQQRIELVRQEVERRGLSWPEFDGKDVAAGAMATAPSLEGQHDDRANATLLSSLVGGPRPTAGASSSTPEDPTAITVASTTTNTNGATSAATNGANGHSSQNAGADRALLQEAMDAGIIQRMSAQEFVDSVMASHEGGQYGALTDENNPNADTEDDGGMHL